MVESRTSKRYDSITSCLPGFQ